MHRYCPCQTDRELGIHAYFLFFNLLLLLIERISDIAPYSLFYLKLPAVVGNDIEHLLGFINGFDDAQRAIYPTLVKVVLYEYYLRTNLQIELYGSGKTAFGEVSLYLSSKNRRVARQLGELLFIDIVYGVAACGKGDG